MQISSSIQEDADAAVREFQERVVLRLKNETMAESDAVHNSKDQDEEMTDAEQTFSSMMDGWPVRIYNISRPNPTITLPHDYHFRTTETGYPIFPRSSSDSMDRTNMTDEQKKMEQCINSFIDRWIKDYSSMCDNADSRIDGMFQLRLECTVRGLVTYGSKEALVTRLVDRALRDAARGWSEVEDAVGRIKYNEAPY